MRFSNSAWLFCAIIPFSIALDPTRLLYQFSKGSWIENLFVRPSGSLLLTLISSQNLYLLDPLAQDPKPHLVHTFASSDWLTGITETEPDTYYVIGANGTYYNVTLTPGSNRIYRVYFPEPSSPAEISLVAMVEDAVFLNGLTTLNPTTLLASDPTLGVIWAIDTTTGASHIAVKDPLTAPTRAFPKIGVNGVRLFKNHTLYFTNSAQALLAEVRINANGTAAGPAKKIASAANGTIYDDFAISRHGDVFLTTGSGDSIAEVTRNGSQRIIASVVNTTEIAEPTSAQFGRTLEDRNVLYVTTAGGFGSRIDGDVVVGGQLVAVDTSGNAR